MSQQTGALEGVQGLDILDEMEKDVESPEESPEKLGRPSKHESGPRNRQVAVMLAEDELKRLDMITEFLGWTRADFMRHVLFENSLTQYVNARIEKLKAV
jgi:hypothetical protein